MKNKIIIYENLNLFTFTHSLIARGRYRAAYFYGYSPLVKKYFFRHVKHLGHKQISHLNYLEAAIEPRGSKKAIAMGKRVVSDNPLLVRPLVRHLGDERAGAIVNELIVHDVSGYTHEFIAFTEFINKNIREDAGIHIYYFPTANNFIIKEIYGVSKNVTVVRWYHFLFAVANLMRNICNLFLLMAAPLLLLLKMIKDKKVVLRKNDSKVSKRILFFHRLNHLTEERNLYRRMYLFQANILNIGDCLHSCLPSPFTDDKTAYLKEEGGAVLNYQDIKIDLSHLWKRLFLDYYRSFFGSFTAISFSSFVSIDVVKSMMMVVSTAIKFESMLERVDAKLSFFETEMGFAPSIFTIVSNKYGIKTMTMMHGVGGYCFPNYARANSVVNYYLVPGNYYTKYLMTDNPYIEKCYPVGNHEIEDLSLADAPNLSRFKVEGRKMVGVLANFYWPFFPSSQGNPYSWPLFDEELARNAFVHYWLPFFKWAARQEGLFFIFKGKSGHEQYNHPFLREALSEIPKDLYYQNDDLLMREVLAVSDYAVCSGNSSALYASLCLGIPSVCYGLSQTGYIAAGEHNDHIVAHTPDGIVRNLEYILAHGLPKETFDKVRRDHHLVCEAGIESSMYVRGLINDIIEKR